MSAKKERNHNYEREKVEMINKCPGAKTLRQPMPETIRCPSCDEEVEIWTDEVKATCPKCKIFVMRQQEGPSCLDWCRYAEECVGENVYNKYMRNKAMTIKQKLLNELEEHFGNDTRRINHAKQVMGFAEKLLEKGVGHPMTIFREYFPEKFCY